MMEQSVQSPATSTAQGTISAGLPTVESNKTLSQSNSCVPPSSSQPHSFDSVLNNAIHMLLDNEKVNQEDTVASAPIIFDPLFPTLISLPQITNRLPQNADLPSQEAFQPAPSIDTPTSSAHGTVSNSMPLVEDSRTTLSQSNSCVPPPSSSTCSSGPELNSALHALRRCSQEENIECMDPYTFDLFFPAIPLSQTTHPLPQGTSQFALKEREVDSFQSSKSTAHSHHSNRDSSAHEEEILETGTPSTSSGSTPESHSVSTSREIGTDCIRPFDLFSLLESVDLLSQGMSQPISMEQKVQPPTSAADDTVSSDRPPAAESGTSNSASCVPPSSTYSSDPELNDVLCTFLDNKDCDQRSRETSDGMDSYIMDLLQIPLPQIVGLPPRESLLSASKEQGVDTLQPATHCQPSGFDGSSATEMVLSEMEQGAVCDLFSLIPLPQTTNPALPVQESSLSALRADISSTAHFQPSSLNHSSATETVVSEMDVCDIFSLIPLPQTTSLPPQESSPSASKEHRADISSTASSSLDGSSAKEKLASEMEQEPVFDLFPLISLPQPINLPPQESSQPASKEQGVDTLQPTMSTVPPQNLPDHQATNVQREMDNASSLYAQCSIPLSTRIRIVPPIPILLLVWKGAFRQPRESQNTSWPLPFH